MEVMGLNVAKKSDGKEALAITKRTKGTVLSAKDNKDGTCTIHIKYATDDSGNPAAYKSNGAKGTMLLANINGTLVVQGHDIKVRGNLMF